MNTFRNTSRHQAGFSMIEVLVALIILLVGLLGLAALMIQGQRSEMESYQRVQALILLQDMAGRINANRKAATCYAFTTGAGAVTPYLGTAPTYSPACDGAAKILPVYPTMTAATATALAAIAVSDMTAWDTSLKGAAETSSGSNVGAMIGARGCVSYNSATELLNPDTGAAITGTGIYTIAVAWQGLGSTAIATPSCAQGLGLYGNEAQRRVVSLTLRIASLTSP